MRQIASGIGTMLCAAMLAACAPTVPDSAAGVGFGDYQSYQADQAAARAAREAQLSGQVTVRPPEATGAPPAGTAPAGGISVSELAAAGIGSSAGAPGAAGRPAGTSLPDASGGAVAAAPPVPPIERAISPAAGQPDPLANRPAAISDEQSFAAVTARESIESDAQRLARLRALRQEVAPQPLQRPAERGPDIVAYALRTTNRVGQPAWRRAFPSPAKAARNCARYASPDLAQRAFIEAGGPERDRLGIDPDGDGFACGWNPQPFRDAVRG